MTDRLAFITFYDLHLCRNGVAIGGAVVADDDSTYFICSAYRIDGRIGLSLFSGLRGVEPFHLTIFSLAIGIVYPQLIRKAGRMTHGYRHTDPFHAFDGKAMGRRERFGRLKIIGPNAQE